MEAVPKDPDAIRFLKNNVDASVAESVRQGLDIIKEDLESKLSFLKSELRKIGIENNPEIQITMSFGAAFGTELEYFDRNLRQSAL